MFGSMEIYLPIREKYFIGMINSKLILNLASDKF